MEPLTAALVGAVIGVATGLLPGLHVNLLAALALTIPGLPDEAAWGLVAVGTVHTFVSILPTTYLGAPEAEAAMSVLPAHRLLQEGAGPEAVRLSLHASMLAALMAVLMLWPMRLLPLDLLQHVAPVVLVAVPTWLALRDARPGRAVAVAAMAALLGHVAFEWPVHGLLPGAATPLLPLLSGLFGVPTLLWALRSQTPRPLQDEPPAGVARGTHRAAAAGVLCASFTAVLPGLTAAVATALSTRSRASTRSVLATLSAVNTAHLIMALAMLWVLGKARSGLGIAWQALRTPQAWPPPDLLMVAAVVLFSGAFAVFATTWLDAPYRRVLEALPRRVPEASALGFVVLLVAATTGWTGMLLMATAVAAGLVPITIGVRRVHLAAALSVPVALRLA